MFLTYLMLVVALCLSVIAEFYSIAGLAAIFAGAPIPIIIMGVILGTAKLSITVWLHEFWEKVKLSMKIYLVSAVMILMFLTSMGIFGFLSKAHIEQVGVGQENAAQIQRITVELKRQAEIVVKAEERAKTLETSGTGADANVNSQLRTEQERIDSALARVQPSIDEQQKIIDGQTKLYNDQVAKVDEQLAQLQKFIDAKEVQKAQALVGANADGEWGVGTARAVTNWKSAREAERTAVIAKLVEANKDPTIRAARDEISRIRKTVETQIAESNKLIDRLRNQLGKGDTASVEVLVNEQQDKIKTANLEIEALTQKKYALEVEYRKLEVEVGPIKYIAELIYGDTADQSMLERAVRWVIMIIVAVFDPLAVMMLLAATESRTWIRKMLPAPAAVPTLAKPAKKKTFKYRPSVKKHRVRIWKRKRKTPVAVATKEEYTELNKKITEHYAPDDGPLTDEQITQIKELANKELPAGKLNAKTDLDADIEPYGNELQQYTMTLWKNENPGKTFKEYIEQYNANLITELPWHHIDHVNKLNLSDRDLITLRLGLEADNEPNSGELKGFGIEFPKVAIKGDMFLRVDNLPSVLYKFNGNNWIKVNKSLSDSYVYDEEYINHLIEKIESGEYDPDLLSDIERERILSKLNNTKNIG